MSDVIEISYSMAQEHPHASTDGRSPVDRTQRPDVYSAMGD